jgi:hypothetical protein
VSQSRWCVSLMLTTQTRLLHVLAFAVVAAPTIGSPADDERIAALRQLIALATGVVQRHVACEIATNELEQLTVAVRFAARVKLYWCVLTLFFFFSFLGVCCE